MYPLKGKFFAPLFFKVDRKLKSFFKQLILFNDYKHLVNVKMESENFTKKFDSKKDYYFVFRPKNNDYVYERYIYLGKFIEYVDQPWINTVKARFENGSYTKDQYEQIIDIDYENIKKSLLYCQ
jgi:hypothetical protein